MQAEVTHTLSESACSTLAFRECHRALTGYVATPHDSAGRRWFILQGSSHSWERPKASRRGAEADCGSVSGFLVENESSKVDS